MSYLFSEKLQRVGQLPFGMKPCDHENTMNSMGTLVQVVRERTHVIQFETVLVDSTMKKMR
jgi:hypothetical protein